MKSAGENVPFLWRLSANNWDGFCVVSMVVPFVEGDEQLEHTIETDVLSFASDNFTTEDEVLEWNEEDLQLFLRLLSERQLEDQNSPEEPIKVDLADPATIEIVQIVAAAGFGLAYTADEHLIAANNLQPASMLEVGAKASLMTSHGFRECIVVDIENEDYTCVILDESENDLSLPDEEDICSHDLLMVRQYHLLHPSYSSRKPASEDILH